MSSSRWIVSAVFTLGLGACSDDIADDNGGVLGGSLTVAGTIVDFQTAAPIAAGASVQTSGLVPTPTVTVNGSAFEITGIPENSAFQILASAPPSHRATFSASIAVTTTDVVDLAVPAVSEAYLAGLATAFGVNPAAARGVLFARVVDANGAPKPGVDAANFVIAGGPAVDGPNFLDANMTAAPTATATSASGWVVFFELAPGVVSLGQPANATVTLDMAISPVNAGTITIAEIKATDGAAPMLTNVSFANQVLPIFSGRGCVACHSGSGVGNDLGGLSLNQGAPKVLNELLIEDLTRVRPGMPEASLLLTMPSREDPPDRHPNVTFASPRDPDYQKIYVWIKEGAKQN